MGVIAVDEFKQTELGPLPRDWGLKRIGDIAVCYSGGTPKTTVAEYYGGPIPWITSGDLNLGRLRDVKGQITKLGLASSSAKMVDKGDLLLALYGATAGVAAITEISAAINQAILAIKPRELNTEYLFQYLQFKKSAYLKTYLQGGQPNLSGDIVKSFLIPVPPTSCEQAAIAGALNDTDAWLASLERLLDKKRRMLQGSMQELLTAKRRLPGCDSAWKEDPISEIAPLQRGFDLPTAQIRQGPYPVVYSNGIGNYNSAAMVKGPGVTTGRSGTLGEVHFVDGPYWPHNTSLWVTSFRGNNPRFIYYLYRFIGFERFASGSGVPTLNRNDAHAYRVSRPLDPLEQEAIADVLWDMDESIAILETKIRKARDIKQGIMNELLTGKVRLI